MLFLLHVVGVEGLHGVGFELVVTVEGGVEAEEKCTVGDGEKLFSADGFGFDVAGQGKSGFEEDFIEQLFWCGFGINMVDVEGELLKNLLRRS